MSAPADVSKTNNPEQGAPASKGKIEAEAADGGARKENKRAEGNADAMPEDEVSDKKEKGKDEDEPDAEEVGEQAVVHSQLQDELSKEIDKMPKDQIGVTNPATQKAAAEQNEQENADKQAGGAAPGDADQAASSHAQSGGIGGKVKNLLHHNK